MTDKQLVLETVQQLPDDVELEEISSEIEFLAAVRKGSKQIAEGKIIPHEQVKEQLRSWLTESSGPK
jgi:predicted transcriptional regulator